jgi:hypothetical protein
MTTTDTPSVRVDETLARFRELQAQFERVRDRLRRAEEQKNTVNRRTFDKVRAEYDRELDALRAKMTPLRDELESHRSSIEGGLRDANASLESVEEEMAELVFRHRVGEYSDTDFAEKRRALEARMEGARTRISEQRRTLDLFETVEATEKSPPETEAFADDHVSAPRAPEPRVATAVRRPSAPVDTAPPADEPAPVRRPVLRARNLDAPSAATPTHAGAKTDARPEKPANEGFENPHDWIKEMGRDAAPARRPTPAAAPAPTPTRPRMSSTPPAGPASRPAQRNPARTPSLVFVNGAHAGESVPLLPTTLTIGREHDNNVELKDPDVARYHARIVYERGNYIVEDLESTTGTWVNGEKTRKSPLNHGDVVRVGSTEIAIDFEWASDPV